LLLGITISKAIAQGMVCSGKHGYHHENVHANGGQSVDFFVLVHQILLIGEKINKNRQLKTEEQNVCLTPWCRLIIKWLEYSSLLIQLSIHSQAECRLW